MFRDVESGLFKVPSIEPTYLRHAIGWKPSNYINYPPAKQLEHTMGKSLPGYVKQRVPELVREVVLSGWKVEIHGVSEEILLRNKGPLDYIDLRYNHWQRDKCAKRPTFWSYPAGKKIIVCIVPGSSYIRHYVGVLTHFLAFAENPVSQKEKRISLADIDDTMTVVTYPNLESDFCVWTNLDPVFINAGDIIVYGYAQAVLTQMLLDSKHGKYKLTQVKHHAWGDLSAKIMRNAAELGAREIFYVSKGATCESHHQIYTKIYCPSEYVVVNYDKVIQRISVRNGLTEMYPELQTGLHASPPCVMEEDFQFRKLTVDLGVESVDNEAAQIAALIFDLNQMRPERYVKFTPIQFPTDYLRRPDEVDLLVQFDLKNNREEVPEKLRKKILSKIIHWVSVYLVSSTKKVGNETEEANRDEILTIIETPSCYKNHVLPFLENSEVMSCLSDIVLVQNKDDLRCSIHGDPLFRIFRSFSEHNPFGNFFIAIPRPEVHPPSQDWSFGRMRRERLFSFVVFWIDPRWWDWIGIRCPVDEKEDMTHVRGTRAKCGDCESRGREGSGCCGCDCGSGGEAWIRRVLEFASSKRGGTGIPAKSPIASGIHKPYSVPHAEYHSDAPQKNYSEASKHGKYYHTFKDLTTREDLLMLRDIRRQLVEFASEIISVPPASSPMTTTRTPTATTTTMTTTTSTSSRFRCDPQFSMCDTEPTLPGLSIYVQYPNAAIKSTLHFQMCYNYEDDEGASEVNRKILLDDLIEHLHQSLEEEEPTPLQKTNSGVPIIPPPNPLAAYGRSYQLPKGSGAYSSLISKIPTIRYSSNTLVVGVDRSTQSSAEVDRIFKILDIFGTKKVLDNPLLLVTHKILSAAPSKL